MKLINPFRAKRNERPVFSPSKLGRATEAGLNAIFESDMRKEKRFSPRTVNNAIAEAKRRK